MNSSMRRIIIGATFFGVTCVGAVTGYMLAGWEFLDAIYMVVITVFGVGYGETKPLDNATLKMFTMGVIIAGCSSGIYVVGGFVQMLAEGEINRVLGTRRMSKGIDSLTGHAILCGFGRVGQMLATDLAAAGHPFVVIDSNAERVADAQAAGYLALVGSASEEKTLHAAGIDRAAVLAAVLPDDTANVFVALTARELSPTIQIIARAESPSTEKKLIRSGCNRVVLPALIGATKIAHLIMRPTAEDMLQQEIASLHLNEDLRQIGLEMGEVELKADSPLVGQTLGDVETSGRAGFVIVAVKKKDGSTTRGTDPSTRLAAGDGLIILGHREALPQLTRRAKSAAQVTYRGATVTG
jgi:voltage-gated potassium channel